MHDHPAQAHLPDAAAATASDAAAATASDPAAGAAAPPSPPDSLPQPFVPVTFPDLPRLSHAHQDLLHALFQHNQDFRALAAATGHHIFDLYAWAASPDIVPWLKLHRTLSAHADRAAALAALRHALATSDSPIEQRRAAVAILRAHSPARRGSPTPASTPGPAPSHSPTTTHATTPDDDPSDDDPSDDDPYDDDPDSDEDSHVEEAGEHQPEDAPGRLRSNDGDLAHAGTPAQPSPAPTRAVPPPAASVAAAEGDPPILFPDELDEYSIFPPDFTPGRHPLAPRPTPTDAPTAPRPDSS